MAVGNSLHQNYYEKCKGEICSQSNRPAAHWRGSFSAF